MKIVVTDGYTLNPGDNPWDEIQALGKLTVYDRTDPSQLMDRISEAGILLVNKTSLRQETLDRLPNLKFIAVTATGFDVVDIAAAALDVVSEEPIRPDNPLLKAKNIILTPHIAWAAREARRRLMQETVENVKAFLSGKPRNVVNPSRRGNRHGTS